MDLDLLCSVFDENFAHHGELRASVSVGEEGREIVSLARGWQNWRGYAGRNRGGSSRMSSNACAQNTRSRRASPI